MNQIENAHGLNGPLHGAGALFSAHAVTVAVGHIHKDQIWHSELNRPTQEIADAGSIGYFHHGEVDDKIWLE